MPHWSIETLEKKKLCCDCVGEAFLSKEIGNKGRRGKCSYCGTVNRCYDLASLSEMVEAVFDEHYTLTANHPSAIQYSMLADKESDYDWYRDGEPTKRTIMNMADIGEEVASDIQHILAHRYYDHELATMGEETAFSSEAHYTEKRTDNARWMERWQEFERILRTETRFFSRSAYELLESIFHEIDGMRSWNGFPVMVKGGPGTSYSKIFRARCFQSDDELEVALARPYIHLGPPPSIHARAGRMNAEGISVFYGANDPKVAIAEVRPPVGSRVAVACFDIIREIQLLNLETLSDVSCRGSLFDCEYGNKLEHAAFLRNLGRLIASPVLPNHERFEYLATQVIADYLATEAHPPVDGIIFPSVQAGGTGRNIVLFNQASRVEPTELPAGTKVTVELGRCYAEGWEEEYNVFEEIPPVQEPSVDNTSPFGFELEEPRGSNPYPATLRIDLETIRIHTVEGIRLKTHDRGVYRHRWERRDTKDF